MAPEASLRLFIGIGCAASTGSRIDAVCAAARAAAGQGLRWIPPRHRHLTLHFLGERPAGELGRLVASLRAALAGCAAGSLYLRDWLWLPRAGRPRLLALSGSTPPELARLYRRSGEALGALGLAPSARPYLAHLTLARVRGACQALDLPGFEPIELPIDHVSLFRSRLLPQGARYSILHRIDLR